MSSACHGLLITWLIASTAIYKFGCVLTKGNRQYTFCMECLILNFIYTIYPLNNALVKLYSTLYSLLGHFEG